MKKLIITLLLAGSLVLSACAKTTSTLEPIQTSVPTLAGPAPTTELQVPSSSELTGPDSGCTVIARQPTPGPTQESLFPSVTAEDHVRGPETAKITIIEYSDFQ